MRDEIIIDEPDELTEGRVAESRPGKAGIEVDELIDIERIELRSRPNTAIGNLGWETVQTDDELEALCVEDDVLNWQPDGPQDEAQSQLADLEDEHLHLAAELAALRRAATERESALQEQLNKARAQLREREAELSDQEAQIASLTLACEGLRAQLSDHDYDTPLEVAGRGVVAAGGNPEPGTTGTVRVLKERLAERANALTVAREEAERLQRERSELANALAERGSQVAKLLARLTRSTRRFHAQDEFRTGLGKLLGQPTGGEPDAAGLPQPGSEEPTLAVDEPAGETATPAQEAGAAAPAQDPGSPAAAEPDVRTTVAKTRRRQCRRQTDVGIRRYLISLDPGHDEVQELAEQRMYVGRGEEADVRVSDATASRLHAVLYLERGSTVVEDACSTNGVYVNKQRIRRAVLLDGDTVAFGTVRFQYRVGPASASQD